MSILTKGMMHEKHMVLLFSDFDQGDPFYQVSCCTYNQKGQIKKGLSK
jgi:hypothetical protein